MSPKIANKIVPFVFLFLGGYLLYYYSTGQHKKKPKTKLFPPVSTQKTPSDNLTDPINIQVDQITEILINAKVNQFEELKLAKENGEWLVSMAGEPAQAAKDQAIQPILKILSNLRLVEAVAKGEENYDEYKVREGKGVKIKVKEGEKTSLDAIIGKVKFELRSNPAIPGAPPKQIPTSFIRLNNSETIYSVADFMEPNFNKRYKTYLATKKK